MSRDEELIMKNLRNVAYNLRDIADEIENGNTSADDWCSDKISVDNSICVLKDVAGLMKELY